MKKERRSQNPFEFKGYLSEGKPRMIYIYRLDLSGEEIDSRVQKIQTAYEQGLLGKLTIAEQDALLLLYPEDLRLRKVSDVAKERGISRQVLDQNEQRLISHLDNLLNGEAGN